MSRLAKILAVLVGLLALEWTAEGQAPSTPTNVVVNAADRTAPIVAITSPTASPTYDAGAATSVNLGGTATDGNGIPASGCTYVNSAGGSGTAGGTTSWTATVSLAIGSNVITVTCRDPSNNTSVDIITVSRSSGGAAATYYVDNACANNGDGTLDTCAASPGGNGAWNVLTSARGMHGNPCTAGDTVKIKVGSGAYINTTNGGDPSEDGGFRITCDEATTGSPFTLTAYDIANPPTLANCALGSTTWAACDNVTLGKTTTVDYVTVSYLKIFGAIWFYGPVTTVEASLPRGITLSHNEIYQGWGEVDDGNWSAIFLHACYGAQVDNNYIHDLNITTGGGTQSSMAGIKLFTCTNSTYERNTIEDITGTSTQTGCIDDKQDSRNNTIQYNWCRRVPHGVRIQQQTSVSLPYNTSATGTVVQNNVFDVTGGSGTTPGRCLMLETGGIVSLTFRNNTCYGVFSGDAALHAANDAGSVVTTVGVLVYNNIIMGSTKHVQFYSGMTFITFDQLDYNIWDSAITNAFSFGGGNFSTLADVISTTPFEDHGQARTSASVLFTDTSTGDLRLQGASPVQNACKSGGVVGGTTMDCGAYTDVVTCIGATGGAGFPVPPGCGGGAVSCTTTTALTQASIQSAINAAADGDVVCIPSGTVSLSSQLTITNQRITLRGVSDCTLSLTAASPACPTVLRVASGTAILFTTCSASDFVTLSHFTVGLQGSGAGSALIFASCENGSGYPPVAFRVHHVQFNGDPNDGSSSGFRWFMTGGVYGLLDHDQFLAQTSRGAGNVSSGRDNSVSTCNTYHHPFAFGDQNAVYVEDSFGYSLTNGQANGFTDNYSGGRIVIRMTTIYNNNVAVHGFESQLCGVPTFEYYGNTFILESGAGSGALTQQRAGTGFMWGNIVRMLGASTFTNFFSPDYYGAMTPSSLNGTAWLNTRASNPFGGRYYPTGTWGTVPIGGVSTKDDLLGNNVTGSNTLDGNQFGPGSMDADYTRTITSVTTVSGSKTITAAGAGFSSTDLPMRIYGTNIKPGRTVLGSGYSISGTTLTCASCNFSVGDVGRLVGNNDASIPGNTTIASVTNSTTAVMSAAGGASDLALLLRDCYLTTINSSTSAQMNCQADGSSTTGTLTVGYTNEGYPLLDQPGRGYFATANAGNWPNAASYTAANYQALMPIYLFANKWQTSGGTWSNPTATGVFHNGVQGYAKANREWFDPIDYAVEPASAFDGTSGTGIGPLANRPATCTAGLSGAGPNGTSPGVGYWATNDGSWNTGTFSYTYPNTGSTYTQGRLYVCTATNTWTLWYTPLAYPHPLQAGP